MDAATCLVLPSRSEGLGRVIVESFARGRAVVASRVGGIADLVEDGENGLLVDSGDAEALAGALVRVLSDPALAERLGQAAHDASRGFQLTADDYAARVRSLVDKTLTGHTGDAARSSSPSPWTPRTRSSARPWQSCARWPSDATSSS